METSAEDRVHERPDEDAERDLVADVADEVPHHAGPELLRRQRQRKDRDGEHHTDDGDDGGGDGDEHLAFGVGGPRADPGREVDVTVERRQVDLEGHEEQQDRHHDEDGRDDPQRRPQLLPAPARQLTPVLADARRLRRDDLVDVAHDGAVRSERTRDRVQTARRNAGSGSGRWRRSWGSCHSSPTSLPGTPMNRENTSPTPGAPHPAHDGKKRGRWSLFAARSSSASSAASGYWPTSGLASSARTTSSRLPEQAAWTASRS